MKNLLITGTGGFIFGNFVNYIKNNNLNYNIICVDKKYAEHILLGEHEFQYAADITDVKKIDDIFHTTNPDIIIHGAAETAVDHSIKDPMAHYHTNVIGTGNLINAAVKYNVKKFVYISTDEVMGHLENDTDPGFTELTQLNPRNPYSASKASGELLLTAAANTYGLKYNITRCSNNYGPMQTSNKLIPRMIKSVLEGQTIKIFGEGAQIRDWTHVDDNCAAIIKILTHGRDNEIYNISANQEYTNITVAKALCDIMGKDYSTIEMIPDPRPGHDFRYSVNSDKLRKLGWEPKHKLLEESLHQCVDWYVRYYESNKKFY